MKMDAKVWMRLAAAVATVAFCGCAKGEQANQSADSTARNLTLAPTESTAAMKDVPAPPEKGPEKAPEKKKEPPKPPAPTSFTLSAGTQVSASVNDSITTRSAKAGDTFTATVSQDVRNAAGHVVIPAGSNVSGTIVAADVIGPTGQGFTAGDFAALTTALRAGVTYANMHTQKFPGGEIRGQIRPGGGEGESSGD